MSPTTTRPDPSDLQTTAALVAAQAATRSQYTTQAVAIATAAAKSFDGWYDTAQITTWSAKLASRIETLQRAQAQSTDAYLARALTQLLGSRVRPVGRISVDRLRKNITHAGAYARAADVYRWQQHQFDQYAKVLTAAPDDALSALQPFDLIDPVEAAIQRVAAVADADIQLADRAQSQASMKAQRDVTGWRRVIHPERSKGGTCGLCIAASDRIYHVDELRAIHDRCECTTLPIVGSLDPGSGLNNLDLQTLYEHAGGSTNRRDLKRTHYSINEHGELGPVLTDGQFRTPARIRKERQRVPEKTPHQRAADVERILRLELGAQDRAHALAKQDPGKWGDYAAQLDARIESLRSQLDARIESLRSQLAA